MVSIIKSIEIRYFRSGYLVRLPILSDVNIISGKNDAGKSNVLKAVNLFFNRKTDWQRDLDFYADFSQERLGIVRKETVKGKQFISVELTFNRPKNFSGSLPEIFKVKRTWHRNTPNYSESTSLDNPNKSGKLPKRLGTARRFLPVFLNRVHYEYVPAVKDRVYHEHLLRRLQKTLLEIRTDSDNQISRTARDLATYIQDKIVDLSEDFARATGIVSSVNPPTEFADLFQAFVVSTVEGEESIPLTLRGDGIQARYVSSVLRYISSKSPDFFIWGFEEPENSLEYSKAIDLANDFTNIYSKEAQIILTTHSPAFTSLQNENTTCYRAYRENNSTSLANLWPMATDYSQREKLVFDLGIMKLQEQLHKEYVSQSQMLKAVETRRKELEGEVSVSRMPLVLVSGKTDKAILEEAWRKLIPRKTFPFICREADNTVSHAISTGGDKKLGMTIETIHPDENRIAVAIFDRDKTGMKEYEDLSANFKPAIDKVDCKIHENNLAYAVLLPIPVGREGYSEAKNLCIEFLFPDEALAQVNSQGKSLRFSPPQISTVNLVGNLQLEDPAMFTNFSLPETYKKPLDADKVMFASEIVPNLSANMFEGFRPLFDILKALLSSGRSKRIVKRRKRPAKASAQK